MFITLIAICLPEINFRIFYNAWVFQVISSHLPFYPKCFMNFLFILCMRCVPFIIVYSVVLKILGDNYSDCKASNYIFFNIIILHQLLVYGFVCCSFAYLQKRIVIFMHHGTDPLLFCSHSCASTQTNAQQPTSAPPVSLPI